MLFIIDSQISATISMSLFPCIIFPHFKVQPSTRNSRLANFYSFPYFKSKKCTKECQVSKSEILVNLINFNH